MQTHRAASLPQVRCAWKDIALYNGLWYTVATPASDPGEGPHIDSSHQAG
jgi:hypothetical protein